jgi:hypothetical protein
MVPEKEPPLSFDDDLYGFCLSIWELFTRHRVYKDIDGVIAEEDYIVEGYVVNINVQEACDPEAIQTIWRYIQTGSRGIMGPDSKVYKLCGPPYETCTRSQFLRGGNERGLEMSLRTVPSVVPWKKRYVLDVGWERK